MTDDNRLLLTYYGDDFTGSTDVLEALALAGVRTALFLEAPRPEQLSGRFAGSTHQNGKNRKNGRRSLERA